MQIPVGYPICFTAHGNPVPKQSFRAKNNGHGYTPARVRAWENIVAWAAREAVAGMQPLTEAVRVECDFYVADKRKKDCTNLWKAVEDACTTAGVWKDDDQVVDMHVRKHLVGRGEGRVVIQIDIKE